jgi:hypothetical protein
VDTPTTLGIEATVKSAFPMKHFFPNQNTTTFVFWNDKVVRDRVDGKTQKHH